MTRRSRKHVRGWSSIPDCLLFVWVAQLCRNSDPVHLRSDCRQEAMPRTYGCDRTESLVDEWNSITVRSCRIAYE
jgi:hypothetical protein